MSFKALHVNLYKVFLFIVLTLLFLHVKISAQNNNYINSNASLAEKIYLQLDGKVYNTGNIIWFKCIVLNAHNHIPSSLSRVLYVEIITPEETVYEKKLIKLENGIGQGFFNLDKTLNEGLYLIRAYTHWNKNFGSDFFFEKYIRVYTPGKEIVEKKPITDITLIKEEININRLEASFNPHSIDSQHNDKLIVYVTLDNKKDTLLVKKGKDNKYRIDYDIENESQFATLQMQTANDQKYSKTIVLNEGFLDLQFFPESGELVHGLKSKVGFKALDATGQGKKIEGEIVDDKDSVIITFESNALGLGGFILNNADSTKKYFARLMSKDIDQILLYPLPDVAARGNNLSVEKKGDNLFFTATSNYLKNDSINLDISFRGVSFYNLKVILKEGIFKLRIPVDKLPEGIISCTMKDNYLWPVAERLYFNEKSKSRISITISTQKNIYAKRELTNLAFETTTSDSVPVKSDLSVLVINKQQLGEMQSMRQNILSYFLLNSELKGKIENPGFYFRKDSIKQNDLDALMLTQGWRKYNYSKQYEELPFQPEYNLTVSGKVSGVFSKRRKKQAELTLLTFGNKKTGYKQTADSLGQFNFNLEDEYGSKINVLIQSSKKSGKRMDYNISLDKKESPPVEFNHKKTVEKVDTVVQVLVEKNVEREKIDDAFPLQSGNILLEEVEVTAFRLTPTRKKVIEEYGEPTEVIDGKVILAKEKKWSYGLYSVLMHNFPDKIIITRARDGNLYASVDNGELTLVVIDGIPVRPYDYSHIPFIPSSEVSSFEVIELADNFVKLFCDLFPQRCKNPPMWGNVIAIFTYAGKGIFGVKPTVGIMQASVPVFSAHREFYTPKYENIESDDWYKPDLRALVHWEPILKTDSLGKASLSFYNADNVGEMTVIVEAVSEKGEIGYQEIDYEIEGKQKEIIIVN